jgi:motility quorum-sensing regulator/GCU-specific mRNA interferase toxin
MNNASTYDPDKPFYDLDEIKDLLQDWRTRYISFDDLREAASLGYADDDEMVSRVCLLSRKEFHKTMPSERCKGLMQDVYYTYDGDVKIYIKLQIRRDGKGVIISFKPAGKD